MKDIKILTHETIPCWYELSWKGNNEQPGLLLRIHSDFVDRAKNIPVQAPAVVSLVDYFGFKNFSGQFSSDFGFEESLKYLGTTNGFLEYEIPTPHVKKFEDERCNHCNGKGYNEELDMDCLWCQKGKVFYYDYDAAYAISASLTLLFNFLRYPEEETNARVPQLMCVNTISRRESHGGSLSGEYGCELVHYLKSRPIGEIPEMISAMRAVWTRMEGTMSHFFEHDFQAYTQGRDGWLNVSCPGDAAGLHPTNGHVDRVRGYEFSCHNVDQPMQQFTLLASLAALHDLARTANQ